MIPAAGFPAMIEVGDLALTANLNFKKRFCFKCNKIKIQCLIVVILLMLVAKESKGLCQDNACVENHQDSAPHATVNHGRILQLFLLWPFVLILA